MPASSRAHAHAPVRHVPAPASSTPPQQQQPEIAVRAHRVDTQAEPAASPAAAQSPGWASVGLRVFWMLWGNLVLLLCAAKVAVGGSTVPQVLLALTAVALVVARYVDITRFAGTTVDGEPATLAHWKRYAAGVVAISLALWTLARMVAADG